MQTRRPNTQVQQAQGLESVEKNSSMSNEKAEMYASGITYRVVVRMFIKHIKATKT